MTQDGRRLRWSSRPSRMLESGRCDVLPGAPPKTTFRIADASLTASDQYQVVPGDDDDRPVCSLADGNCQWFACDFNQRLTTS